LTHLFIGAKIQIYHDMSNCSSKNSPTKPSKMRVAALTDNRQSLLPQWHEGFASSSVGDEDDQVLFQFKTIPCNPAGNSTLKL